MKNIMKYNLWLLGLLFIVSSCTEYDGDDRGVEVTPKLGTATVNLIMAVTAADDLGGDGIDMWIDEVNAGQKMQPGDALSVEYEFPQGTMFRSVLGGKAPKYLSNPIGSVETIITVATAADLLPATHNEPLQGQLKDGASYTLIHSGFGGLNHDFEHMFKVEDDMTPPSGGNAKVRFVNAAGGECWDNTCEISFQIAGTDYGAGVWGNDVFGAGLSSITPWAEITPGSVTVDTFDGDGDAYFSGSVTLVSGGIYTVIISGNVTNDVTKDEPLRLNTLSHL
jgi:hypothetical protein